VRASNVRQLALERLQSWGGRCRCLRCREAGRGPTPPASAFTRTRFEYRAGGGLEAFYLYEDAESDRVAGFLRLRFPSDGDSGVGSSPIVRELRVLGPELEVGRTAEGPEFYQHRGLGRTLLAAAEAEARDRGFAEIRVMSAVGTRGYYRARGYGSAPPYMAKRL